jgi:hypothetical protein
MVSCPSASYDFFDVINSSQEAGQTAYPLNGVIILPAIGKLYTLINGGLENYKTMPGVKRILQAQQYRIVWNKIIVAPAG